MSSLRSKTVKGIASLTLGKGVGRLISFVNTLILARILSPEDYGLMALAMVVCGFITFFNEIGLGSAIIQKKHVSKNYFLGKVPCHLFTATMGTTGHSSGMVTVEGTIGASPLTGV